MKINEFQLSAFKNLQEKIKKLAEDEPPIYRDSYESSEDFSKRVDFRDTKIKIYYDIAGCIDKVIYDMIDE